MFDDINDIVDLNSTPENVMKPDNWRNVDNVEMYENISINVFEKLAAISGIEDNKDIDAIYNKYIRDAQSILELGSGYGRVVEEIRNRGYSKLITCVDRNQQSCELLKEKFGTSIETVCADITKYATNQKFDLILWLWFGFAEFSQTEQISVLQHISTMLNDGGQLIIDLVEIDANSAANKHANLKNPYFHTKFGTNYHYLPSHQEMENYAEHCSLSTAEVIAYSETYMKKNKILYVFKK